MQLNAYSQTFGKSTYTIVFTVKVVTSADDNTWILFNAPEIKVLN